IRDKLVTGVQTCALPIWQFFEEAQYQKHDLTSLCHVSGFGALHYVRSASDRGKSHDARIMEALARANRKAIRRLSHAQSTIEARSEERRVGKEERARE